MKEWRIHERALQVFPAETWLTVYRRRPIWDQWKLNFKLVPAFAWHFAFFSHIFVIRLWCLCKLILLDDRYRVEVSFAQIFIENCQLNWSFVLLPQTYLELENLRFFGKSSKKKCLESFRNFLWAWNNNLLYIFKLSQKS